MEQAVAHGTPLPSSNAHWSAPQLHGQPWVYTPVTEANIPGVDEGGSWRFGVGTDSMLQVVALDTILRRGFCRRRTSRR